MLGKKAARADSTLASAEARIRLGGADVGALEQQLRRQSRGHPRNAQPIEAAALDHDLDRRPADQHREHRDVLAQRLVEQRDRRAHLVDQALLLRDVELRRGAGLEPLLDQGENPVGGGKVLARDPQVVLRCEHLEIGGADGHDGGEDDHFLGEAAGDGVLLRRARGGAVLAPEIDLIAGVERGVEDVALGSAGRPYALGETGKIDLRQQRRAGDLGLRVGLHDAPDGGADVEVGGLRLLDQIGELARAEAAPPIERGRRGYPVPGAIFGRDFEGDIRPLGAENTSGEHLHET